MVMRDPVVEYVAVKSKDTEIYGTTQTKKNKKSLLLLARRQLYIPHLIYSTSSISIRFQPAAGAGRARAPHTRTLSANYTQ